MTKQIGIYCQDGYMPVFPASITENMRRLADLIDNDPREVAVIEIAHRDGADIIGVRFWDSAAEFEATYSMKTDT